MIPVSSKSEKRRHFQLGYPSVVLYDKFPSEEKWLDEMQQMLTAASDHVERLKIEKEKLSEHK